MTGVLPPGLLKKGQQGRRYLFTIESGNFFFRDNFKEIYCSYSCTITFKKIFYKSIIFEVNIVAAQKQALLVTIPLPSTPLLPPALPLFNQVSTSKFGSRLHRYLVIWIYGPWVWRRRVARNSDMGGGKQPSLSLRIFNAPCYSGIINKRCIFRRFFLNN